MGKKKVLIIIPDLNNLGGVANFYKTMLPLLENDRISSSFLEIGSAKKRGKIFYPLADQLNCAKLLKKNVDLFHINPSLGFKSFIRDGILIYQAVRKNIPVVVFFRGWDVNFSKQVENHFFKFFCAVYGKADSFIVLSSEFKEKLRSWNIQAPIFIETTTVDPVLIEHFDINVKLKSIYKKSSLKILFLARIEAAKGIFETVDAVKTLLDKNLPVTLTIAGDGAARNQLLRYIHQLGVPSGKINFLGYVRGKQKASVFEEHDIYCFPTTHGEGLPNSVLEALAFGMPVITCAVGGLPDIIKDDEMGSLVPTRNAQAVADSIEKMICDRKSMARMAQYNHIYAKENFLAPKVAKRLLNIYQQTIRNSVNGW